MQSFWQKYYWKKQQIWRANNMYKYTEELEEITDQEAAEKDRYFRVRKRHYQNYCDFMEEITNGNIIRD